MLCKTPICEYYYKQNYNKENILRISTLLYFSVKILNTNIFQIYSALH